MERAGESPQLTVTSEPHTTSAAGWWLAAAGAVVRRPWLWGVAARQLLRLASPGWWRRWPPVPAPDPDYLRFRLQTAYGDDRAPAVDDVVTYLSWCRSWRRVAS